MKKIEKWRSFSSSMWKIVRVMKISVFLIFLCSLQLSASVMLGQQVNLKSGEISVRKAFRELKKQTGIYFMYNEEDVSRSLTVDLDLKEAKLGAALDEICGKASLAYEVVEDYVLITKKDSSVTERSEQQKNKRFKEIQGVVTDDQGIPLPGVSIVVKGTTLGVSTDVHGHYHMTLPEDIETLVFSFVGMEIKEIAYTGQSVLNVTLRNDNESLNEVVVTGYQTISKERATGSFEKVAVSHIEKPSSNISERLVGMMAGVNATVSADGEVDFEIRGQSSLNADAQPLIVVDGFPIAAEKVIYQGDKLVNVNPFNSINPNDVESVTVLKDAAAASIWGAKSANGVIVITTKKAKKGEAKVNFSSFVKISPKLDLNYVNPIASSAQTIDYEKKGFESDLFGGAIYWRFPNQSITDVEKSRSLAFIAMNEHRLGRISESEMNSTLGRLSLLNNQKQIKDHLLQNPVTQQYNLSVSGGSEKMSNYLSLMYEDNKNNFKENSIDRFMVNYRSRVQLEKWLDFNFSSMIQFVNKTENGVSLSEIKKLQPYDMLIDDKGNLNDLNYLYYYKPVMDEMIPKNDFSYSDWSYNPISEIKRRDLTSSELNIRLQGELKAKIIEGLSYDTKIMYEHFTSKGERIYDEDSFNMRRMVNETSTWNRSTGELTPNMPKGAALQQESTTVRNYNFRNQLNFHRVINEKHTITLVAGTEISNKVLEKQNHADLIGYNKDRLTSGRLLNEYSSATKTWLGTAIDYAYFDYNISLDPANTLRYNPMYNNYYKPEKFSYTTDRYFSMYGNLSYTLNNKYTLTGSVRTDASNLITDDPKYRYAPFWSIGFGWQLGKEEFLENSLWLDRLNVRATFGYNGNVDKSTSFRPLISIGSVADIYTNDVTARISNYGNPTLRWEKTQAFDFGFDFSLFSSKLHGSVDYYYKKGLDLIVQQTIASFNGTTSQKFNNGEMVNKGIELKLGTSIPIKGKDIKWSGNLNFAYNKNKITKFYKISYHQSDLYIGGSRAYSEGMDANTIWAYEYAGVKNLGTENDPKYGPTIKGVNGEVYNLTSWSPGSDARKYMKAQGTIVAPYIIGFQNMFKLYDFDLSVTITGKFGHVYRRHAFNYPNMSEGNTYVNNKYSEVANSDPSRIIPLPTNEPRYYFWGRFHPYMSYLTADASHIRFQEVTLTYNFPKNIVSKLGFNNARVFAQANNLGTIVFNDFNEDPEYPIGTLKPQTAFTFGVKLNL